MKRVSSVVRPSTTDAARNVEIAFRKDVDTRATRNASGVKTNEEAEKVWQTFQSNHKK